jgi:predicted nucleic acid-binding protein
MTSQRLILDSNILVSLLSPSGDERNEHRREEVLRALRRYYLFYEDVLVADVVLEELRLASRRIEKGDELDQLIESLALTKVATLDRVDRATLDNYKHYAPKRAVEADIFLISYAVTENVDIYTLDLYLLKHVNEHQRANEGSFSLSFPIDDEKLKALSFREIRKHGEVFRSTYSSMFQRLKELDSELISQGQGLNKLMTEKEQRLNELQHVITDKDSFIAELKNLAKPNLGFTLVFSAIELALGFVPIPVPTSPISHILQEVQYRKVMRKYEE